LDRHALGALSVIDTGGVDFTRGSIRPFGRDPKSALTGVRRSLRLSRLAAE
jgi:hypothetical protein